MLERPRRYYSKEKSRQMFLKIEQTKAVNRRARLAATIKRHTDELERAKLALQRRGYIVFAHKLRVPFSKLYVVGNRLMTRDELIAHAARFSEARGDG